MEISEWKSHPRSPYDSNAWLRRLSFEKKKKMQQNILHYSGIVVYSSLVFWSCLMQYKQNEMETYFKPCEVWEQRMPSASMCVWGTLVIQFDFIKVIRTVFSNCLNCMQIHPRFGCALMPSPSCFPLGYFLGEWNPPLSLDIDYF